MTGLFEALIRAACRAPSGDNTQPWRFQVDPERRRIEVHIDETRDRSPMNAGQRMARIAAGAAVENLLRSAKSAGWESDVRVMPLSQAIATIDLAPSGSADSPPDECIQRRVTNRRVYDRRPAPVEIINQLRSEVAVLPGVAADWITERRRIDAAAAIVQQADALMFGEPSMRSAFLANVRFDRRATEEVEEGLSLASLELSVTQRIGLRLLPHLPDRAVRTLGVICSMAAQSRRLVESASGLCLIVAEEATPASDLLVGRLMQRAWLALTSAGLSAQPMMSLPVLENAIQHGTDELRQSLGVAEVNSLRTQCRDCFPEAAEGRIAFLLRFGYAPPPSGRTGRRPLDAVMSLHATSL